MNLKRAWKEAIKETIWLFTDHQQGPHKNICVFANRRGGSTWLMEIIAANRGIRYINQPFALFAATSNHSDRLPIVDTSQFIYLDTLQEQKTKVFAEDIFAGRLMIQAPWEFWTSSFDFRSDRMVLKILDAKGLIDWFDTHFDVHIIYFSRHPIPTALSIIRNQWELTTAAYLRHAAFVDKHLDAQQEAYCWDVARGGTLLEQHVLNWALENLIPLRLLPERLHWLDLSYEAAMLYPDATLARLRETLHLTDHERMERMMQKASRSTKKLRSTLTNNEDAWARLKKWRQGLSEAEEQATMQILERLHIDRYVAGSVVPRHLSHPSTPATST